MLTKAANPRNRNGFESLSSMALVCLPDPDEREYAFLQDEIRLRNLYLHQLEDELAPLLAALDAFERDYRARVGTLQTELRELTQTIQTLDQRTARIHARLVADPDGVLGEIFTRDELQQIGELFDIEIPNAWFAHEEELERRARERQWRFHESAEGEYRDRASFGKNHRSANKSSADPELRTLYRRLARLCHPDLANDERDRAQRQDTMHRINAAWHAGDLAAMREIEHDLVGATGRGSVRSWVERLAWARRELVRLDTKILAMTERLQSLRNSETYPLWTNPALGNSMIASRATTLRIDIANAQHRLERAREAFRQALRYYAAVAS